MYTYIYVRVHTGDGDEGKDGRETKRLREEGKTWRAYEREGERGRKIRTNPLE